MRNCTQCGADTEPNPGARVQKMACRAVCLGPRVVCAAIQKVSQHSIKKGESKQAGRQYQSANAHHTLFCVASRPGLHILKTPTLCLFLPPPGCTHLAMAVTSRPCV